MGSFSALGDLSPSYVWGWFRSAEHQDAMPYFASQIPRPDVFTSWQDRECLERRCSIIFSVVEKCVIGWWGDLWLAKKWVPLLSQVLESLKVSLSVADRSLTANHCRARHYIVYLLGRGPWDDLIGKQRELLAVALGPQDEVPQQQWGLSPLASHLECPLGQQEIVLNTFGNFTKVYLLWCSGGIYWACLLSLPGRAATVQTSWSLHGLHLGWKVFCPWC